MMTDSVLCLIILRMFDGWQLAEDSTQETSDVPQLRPGAANSPEPESRGASPALPRHTDKFVDKCLVNYPIFGKDTYHQVKIEIVTKWVFVADKFSRQYFLLLAVKSPFSGVIFIWLAFVNIRRIRPLQCGSTLDKYLPHTSFLK